MEANFNRKKTSASNRSGRSRRSGASQDKKSNKTSDKEKEKEDNKSHKSGISGKSSIRGLSEDAKSLGADGVAEEEKEPEVKDYTVEPEISEKGWFTKANIQKFLFTYIGEKMRTANMSLMVGHSYKTFLESLPQPMELNTTRKNMKDEAYKNLRTLLRTPENFGDQVLGNMCADPEKIGISANVFNTVWEGFWDLYYKRPVPETDLNTKKFEGWITNINLSVPKYGEPAKPSEDEGAEPEPPTEAPTKKAIVRIRIPFEEPPPKDLNAEEAVADDKSQKSQRSRRSNASRKSKVPTEPVKKEIEWEDRVLAVPSLIDSADYQILVCHQLP
jgi:hypothetical protein